MFGSKLNRPTLQPVSPCFAPVQGWPGQGTDVLLQRLELVSTATPCFCVHCTLYSVLLHPATPTHSTLHSSRAFRAERAVCSVQRWVRRAASSSVVAAPRAGVVGEDGAHAQGPRGLLQARRDQHRQLDVQAVLQGGCHHLSFTCPLVNLYMLPVQFLCFHDLTRCLLCLAHVPLWTFHTVDMSHCGHVTTENQNGPKVHWHQAVKSGGGQFEACRLSLLCRKPV